jgi:hypothetical protein
MRKIKMEMVETFFKQKTFRSEKYKAFIRKQPCLICEYPVSEHHHEALNGKKGVALKCPDNEALPLCARHHRERHNIGRDPLFEKYGFLKESWKTWVMVYQSRYEEIHGRIKK